MGPHALLEWLAQDAQALQALEDNKTLAFLDRVHQQFPATESFNDTAFYRNIKTWIAQPDCPENLAKAAMKGKKNTMKKRVRHRHFIYETGLNVSDADREAKIASIPVRVVEPLDAPYPPFKEIISESLETTENWYDYFETGYQPDARLRRLPIHQLDPNALVLDIPAHESVRLETKSGELVGLVMRDFCPNKDAMKWADAMAAKQVPFRRNIRVCPITCSLSIYSTCVERRYGHFGSTWLVGGPQK